MDWKTQVASSIEATVQASVEASLQRSMYASVEESADETARRRTSWFGEAGRRHIELPEDRARRDPAWAEKMARRHAKFAATSASVKPQAVSSHVDIAATTPATCSTQCSSGAITVSVSALIPSAAPTPSTTTGVIVPERCCCDPEPAVVTSTLTFPLDVSGTRSTGENSLTHGALSTTRAPVRAPTSSHVPAVLRADSIPFSVQMAGAADSISSAVGAASICNDSELALAAPITCSTECPEGDNVAIGASAAPLATTTSSPSACVDSVVHEGGIRLAAPGLQQRGQLGSSLPLPMATLTTSPVSTTKPAAGSDLTMAPPTVSSVVCHEPVPDAPKVVLTQVTLDFADSSGSGTLVSMLLPFQKPEGADPDTTGKHEDEQLLAGSSVERPLVLFLARNVVDDHSFITGTSVVPITLAALVDDSRVANLYKVLWPLKLLVPLSNSMEMYVPPLLPQCTQAMVTWSTSLIQFDAKFNGMCSDLGCASATTYLISLLPWDPGEKTGVLIDSGCNKDISSAAYIKQFVPDLSGSGENESELWSFFQFAKSNGIQFVPWDPGQPIFGISTKLTTVSGVACLQGSSSHEMFSCSFEVETTQSCMVVIGELQPWPSWQIFLTVLTQMECFCDIHFCTSWPNKMVLKNIDQWTSGDISFLLQLAGGLHKPNWFTDGKLSMHRAVCVAWPIALECSVSGSKSGQRVLPTTVAYEGYLEKRSAVLPQISAKAVQALLLLIWCQSCHLWFQLSATNCVLLVGANESKYSALKPWHTKSGNFQLMAVKISYSVTATYVCTAGLYVSGHLSGICSCRIILTEYKKLLHIACDFRECLLLSTSWADAKDHGKGSLTIPWDPGVSCEVLAIGNPGRRLVHAQTFIAMGLFRTNHTLMANIFDVTNLLSRVQDVQVLLKLVRSSEQAESKGRTNAAAQAYCHWLDHAYYFDKAYADHDYYLDVIPDHAHISHIFYIGVFLEQVCAVGYLNLVNVHLNYGIQRELGEVMKHQVPWDPGGPTCHRLKVKPKIKEGGMLATIPYYHRGLDSGPVLMGLACSMTTGGHCYKYHGDSNGMVWLGLGRLRPPRFCLLYSFLWCSCSSAPLKGLNL